MQKSKKNRRMVKDKNLNMMLDLGMFWKEFQEFWPILDRFNLWKKRIPGSEHCFRMEFSAESYAIESEIERKAEEILGVHYWRIMLCCYPKHDMRRQVDWDWEWKPMSKSSRWSFKKKHKNRIVRYSSRRIVRDEMMDN